MKKSLIVALILCMMPLNCASAQSSITGPISIEVNKGNTVIKGPYVVPLRKDQKAPYDGILANQAQEMIWRQMDQDAQRNKELLRHYKSNTLQYKKKTDILEQRVDNYKSTSETLAEKLHEARDKNGIAQFLYFVAGALVTIGIGFAIGKAARQ